MSQGTVPGFLAKGVAGAVAENFGKKETKPTTLANAQNTPKKPNTMVERGKFYFKESGLGDLFMFNFGSAAIKMTKHAIDVQACSYANCTIPGRMYVHGETFWEANKNRFSKNSPKVNTDLYDKYHETHEKEIKFFK